LQHGWTLASAGVTSCCDSGNSSASKKQLAL